MGLTNIDDEILDHVHESICFQPICFQWEQDKLKKNKVKTFDRKENNEWFYLRVLFCNHLNEKKIWLTVKRKRHEWICFTFAWCKEIVPESSTSFLRFKMTTCCRKDRRSTLFNISKLKHNENCGFFSDQNLLLT